MECARYSGRPAVATCNLCGKGLCSECAERFSPPVFMMPEMIVPSMAQR